MISRDEFNKVLPILYDAIHTFGGISQLGKAEEEAREFLEAVENYKDLFLDKDSAPHYKGLEEALIDETADIFVMALQVAIMTGMTAVKDRFMFKVNRLEQLLKEMKDDSERDKN